MLKIICFKEMQIKTTRYQYTHLNGYNQKDSKMV